MQRFCRVSLALLLTCLLALTAPPLNWARAEANLTWEMFYDYSPNQSFPPPAHLPTYLGINRSDLTADSLLSISLKLAEDSQAELTATLTVGEQKIHLSGQGSFGYLEQTPLQQGKFEIETEAGVAGQLYLQTYPKQNDCLARLIFGEGTTMPVQINFGEDFGNMYAIISQRNAYVKTLAKLPSGYELDGQQLTLAPAPLSVCIHSLRLVTWSLLPVTLQPAAHYNMLNGV